MIGIAPEAVRSLDLAIDFGTASVRLTTNSQHVRERRSTNGERHALAGGVVVDREAASEILRPILYWARRWAGFSRVRVLACAPSDASAEEKAALADCIVRAGASAVYISPEPLAAAIGAGIDMASPYAKLLMDIGEGVTDCAVIRSAQVFRSMAVRVACSDLRKAIQQGVCEHHQVSLSDDEAGRLLRVAGVREDAAENVTMEGSRDGKACSLTIPATELQAALAPQLAAILGNLETLLHDLPPALSAEGIEEGIYLTGGGALLKGMPEQVVRVAQMDVRVVADPLGAVVSGIRAMLPVASTLRLWGG
jgi:rod shape-determining protein MreB